MFFETLFPVLTAAVAMVMDLRTSRVDNGWIVFCICIGLAVQTLSGGIRGFLGAVFGIILPLLFLGGLFVFRMLGPGDIKLFCALGCMLGGISIGKCILVSLFIGAGISLAILISVGEFRQRFHYFAQYFSEYRSSRQKKSYYNKDINALENFHFTVPVFLSVMLYAGGVY